MPDGDEMMPADGKMPDGVGTVATWPCAVSEWTLRETVTERALGRIADAGFAAVELGGREPDPVRVARALTATGLAVTSVCPLLGPDRDLAADTAEQRRVAVDALRRWMDLAGEVGAQTVIVVPSDRPAPVGSRPRPEFLQRAAESISVLTDEFGGHGPTLVLEALNRYETHLVRSLADAEELRQAVGSSGLALMADLFHMSIEEDSMLIPLERHHAELRHVHLADNQRRRPGSGQLDWAAVFGVLARLGYRGTFAMEFLPATNRALLEARRFFEGVVKGLTPSTAGS